MSKPLQASLIERNTTNRHGDAEWILSKAKKKEWPFDRDALVCVGARFSFVTHTLLPNLLKVNSIMNLIKSNVFFFSVK